jgi:hypothetical protein
MQLQRIALAFVMAASMTAACGDDGDGGGSGGTGGATGGTGGGTGGRGGSGGSTGGTGGATGGSGGATGGSGGATGGSGGSGGATGGSGGSGGSGGTGGGSPDMASDTSGDTGPTGDGGGSTTMSFFVTSESAGMGGNLGGLAGADAKCQALATAVGAGGKTWKAYLSTATENARDRIGQGPWRNQKGEIIANNLTQLHDQGMNGTLNSTWPIGPDAVPKILDEKGMPVPSGGGGMPQRHDIVTGTNAMGMVDGSNHCNNWTSMSGADMVTVGHSNRAGGMRDPSWTTAHTVTCSPTGITSGGGRGSIYCFATN